MKESVLGCACVGRDFQLGRNMAGSGNEAGRVLSKANITQTGCQTLLLLLCVSSSFSLVSSCPVVLLIGLFKSSFSLMIIETHAAPR